MACVCFPCLYVCWRVLFIVCYVLRVASFFLLLVSCDAFGVAWVLRVVCYLIVDDRCALRVAFLVCGLLDSDCC